MSGELGGFDLGRILMTLDRHGIEYLLVGGLGARRDAPNPGCDFVPQPTRENLTRLAGALRELDARLRVAGMTDEEARQLPVVIDAATLVGFGSTTLATDAGSIDVLHDLPTVTGRRSMTICRRGRRRPAWMASSSASSRSPTSSPASSTLTGPGTVKRCLSYRNYNGVTQAPSHDVSRSAVTRQVVSRSPHYSRPVDP